MNGSHQKASKCAMNNIIGLMFCYCHIIVERGLGLDLQCIHCKSCHSKQALRKVWKSRWAFSTYVNIICPPGWYRVNWSPKNWGTKAPPLPPPPLQEPWQVSPTNSLMWSNTVLRQEDNRTITIWHKRQMTEQRDPKLSLTFESFLNLFRSGTENFFFAYFLMLVCPNLV